MALTILSFVYDGKTWRIANSPEGYFHREQDSIPEWLVGLPHEVPFDVVENTFQQFDANEHALQPQSLSFKMTYRVGHSNTDCYIFSSPEGDPFSVKIPPATFAALDHTFPSEALPRLRIARVALGHAITKGLPSFELLPDTPCFDTIRSLLGNAIS